MKLESDNRPIQLLCRRLGCQNTKFNVYLDHISDQSGNEVEAYLVVSSNEKLAETSISPLPNCTGVGVLPLADGMMGLQKMFRHPIGDWGWEIPRGFIDAGETPQEAARRELTEETGLVVPSMDNIISLGTIYPEPGVVRARNELFIAMDCVQSFGSDRELGLGQFQWFKVEDGIKMASDSTIQCASSVTAILRYALLLSGGK